jgi:drug/metabolite transporter (DMT)-like permease
LIGANIGLFFTIIAWGSTAPVINELLKQTDPIVLTTARFLLTSFVFFVWLEIAEGKSGRLIIIPWRQVLSLGLIMTTFSLLFTYAIQYSNPINVSIIVASGPVVASLVNWMMTGEKPQKVVYVSIPLAVIGGIVASVDIRGLINGEGGLLFEGGEIFMLFGVFLWSLYSALLQKWFVGVSQLRRTALTFFSATPMFICIAVVVVSLGWETLPAGDYDTKYLGFFIWSSLATSILGTYLWNIGVKNLGIIVATIFLNLIPIVAILVSMMFGIEPRIEQLIGGVLVIAAVAQAQVRGFMSKK